MSVSRIVLAMLACCAVCVPARAGTRTKRLDIITKGWQRDARVSPPSARKVRTVRRARLLHRQGKVLAQRLLRGARYKNARVFKNLDAAYASPKLRGTGPLHKAAFRLLERAAPVIAKAQVAETRALLRLLDSGRLDDGAYEAALADVIQESLAPYGLELVYLRDYDAPNSVETIADRFDNLQTWVDVLPNGPGNHGHFTHPFQLLVVLPGLRELGFSNKEIHAWYRSMGPSAPVSFGRETFRAHFTKRGQSIHGKGAHNRSPWVVAFERFHGETSPWHLSDLLSVAMIHPYFSPAVEQPVD